MPEIRIQPRDVYEHYVYVERKNTTLQWRFSTKKKNISFGLFFRPGPPVTHLQNAELESVVTSQEKRLTLCEVDGQLSTVSTWRRSSSDDKRDSSPVSESLQDPLSANGIPSLDTQAAMRERRRSSTPISPTHAIAAVAAARRRKSVASINLRDKDFEEILPIEHVNSASEEIVGIYTVGEPGNYVLLFDNTYSKNTSKILSFTVTSDETIREAFKPGEPCDVSGWLLKKRRKRMQGWAKRWFELSPSGVLSYSMRPNDMKRGSIQTMLSTISIYPRQRTLHVDSGATIYHLKALSAENFDMWVTGLRQCRTMSCNPSPDIVVDEAWLMAESLSDKSERAHADKTIMKSLESIDQELKLMRTAVAELRVLTELKQWAATSPSGDLHPSTATMSPVGPSTVPKRRFPFKRNVSQPCVMPPSNNTCLEAENGDISSQTSLMDMLTKSIEVIARSRDELLAGYILQQRINSQHTCSYDSSECSYHSYTNNSKSDFTLHPSSSAYSFCASLHSDLFYDAQDFILSHDDDEDADEEAINVHGSIIDTDGEDDEDGSFDDPLPSMHSLQLMSLSKGQQVQRRTHLPHPVAGHSVSALSILRKNIGKDLSTIAMPVSLNEPLNLLQRLCEELEYSELLDKASMMESSMDQLVYVATFAISGYASSQYRLGRKFWNPLMSETYECIRPDRGFRFIAEKVCHNPNIIACHAESKNFKFWQTCQGKTKFWGKSMELISEGIIHVSLGGNDFSYNKPSSWMRNMIAGSKYLEHVGEMRVTNHTTGEYAVVTFKESTGGGLFGGLPSNRDCVVAQFFDSQHNKLREITGKWSESLSEVIDKDQYIVLWRAHPPSSSNHQEYYGFTQFAMELNEITEIEKDMIPVTDTRYRPDQRLFENGEVTRADDEKLRVEQLQRDRRKVFEAESKAWLPLWFEPQNDPAASSGESWQYKGGYWEARNSGDWPNEMLTLW
ncbi:Oxysterol-binding protein-domain-containing protein [Radiomyces spectabilis]|uniref:Oxysterol-binding protein-domain-containing protein n=1 Tax=Radiomyces spectabilis TaxID=64574 RepID=UPI002220A2FE|nr:Oxysterol-binding protein-domain-containing protein [Radiomyces spectabilis]KAI8394249.1 Oxysterol-binding protein-domain-containing protein [Radiomyces spectabilis]